MKTTLCVIFLSIAGMSFAQVPDSAQPTEVLRSHESPIWSDDASMPELGRNELTIPLLSLDRTSKVPFWLSISRRKQIDIDAEFRPIKRLGEAGRGWFTNWESTLSIDSNRITQLIGGSTMNKFTRQGRDYVAPKGSTLKLKFFGNKGAETYLVTDISDGTVFRYETLQSFGEIHIPCLTAVEYPDGRAIKLSYIIPPLIHQVSDSTGQHVFTFKYNGHDVSAPEENYLDSIELKTQGGPGVETLRAWSFRRYENGNLKSIFGVQ